MAVQYFGVTLAGLSTDAKPTLAANEKGGIFIETDTKKMFRWDGDDSWDEVEPARATRLKTARTISSTGDVTWTATFDGSGNVSGTAAIGSGVIVDADVNASAAIAMSKTALVGGTGLTLSTNTLNVDAAQTQITSVGNLNAGSITSGFGSIDTGSSNITTTGTITAGNLSVTGTTTTVNSTNTTITDRLIELASGAGSSTADAGIIIERGSTGDNAIMAWDESADRFIFGTTTATGSSTGDLTITAGTIQAALVGNVTGRADTATTLHTARTIGGVSFDGSANINLPGVNATGDQNTTGNAATASVATTVTLNGSGNVTYYPTFVDATSGNENIRVDSDWTYNASTNKMTVGNIGFADNGKIEFGDSQDFKIYHDGTTNIIDGGGTADIKIQDSSHTSAIFDTSAEVQLYYDNSKKFETTAAGATITGDLTTTSITMSNNAARKILGPLNESLQLYSRPNQAGEGIHFSADNSTVHMAVNYGGNVGIGLNNPTSILDIVKESTTVWDTSNWSGGYNHTAQPHELAIRNTTDNTTGSYAGIFFMAGETSANSQKNAARIAAIRTAAFDTDIAFATRTSDGSMNEVMRIRDDGLLTLTPQANGGTISIDSPDGAYFKLDRGATSNDATVEYYTAGALKWKVGMDSSGGATDAFEIKRVNNATPDFMINSSGGVGIGTATPDYALEIEGSSEVAAMVHYTNQSRGGIVALQTQRTAFATTATSDDLVFGHFTGSNFANTFVEIMRVDNGTSRVGIGTNAPSTPFHVVGNTTLAGHTYFGSQGSNYDVVFYGSTSGQNAVWDASDKSLEFADAASATFGTGGDMKIWHNSNVNRIDLTSPLYIYDASNYVSIGEHASSPTLEMKIVGAADHDTALYFGDANDPVEAGIWWDTSAQNLHFQGYNNTTRMTIDNAGHVGINATPETDWNSSFQAIHLGNQTAFANFTNRGGYWMNNLRYNTSQQFTYIRTDEASVVDMVDGAFRFRSAASGSADANAAPTVKFYIANSGNIGIGGTTTPSYKLELSGNSYLGGDVYLNHTGNKIEASASYNMITANGYMRLQSNGSVYVALDQDNGGTGAVFAVRANGGGTDVFSVSEAGQVKITGGSPGADKVLTSDANGLATWEEASSGGGTGTAIAMALIFGSTYS